MKKNKVLKNLFLCFFVVAGGACFSISKDSALFKKIHSAYSGADYPAVIEYSSRLQKDFSSSPFLEKALLCKGESFFYLGRFEDSIQTLNELSSSEKNETKSEPCHSAFRFQNKSKAPGRRSSRLQSE